jgi:hypothetical protein
MHLGDVHENDFDTRVRAGLAAVARRDLNAIAGLIGQERSGDRQLWKGELRGLLLLGNHGDKPFANDNPWGISRDADLAGALRLVWASVADRCPDFVTTIMRETLGLALVWESGRYLLGYLYLNRPDWIDPPQNLDDLPAMAEEGWISWTWGGSPIRYDAETLVGAMACPVPPPVRDLARIHSSLASEDGDIRLDAFNNTLNHLREHYGYRDIDGVRAGTYDRYVHFVDWGPGGQSCYLNLDELDSPDAPWVAIFDGQHGRISGRMPFFNWLDRYGPLCLFNA